MKLVGLAIAAALVVIAAAQLTAPMLVAHGIRRRLERDGAVLRVRVRAFPGFRLLWGGAHSVDIRLGDYRLTAAQLHELLRQGGEVDVLRVSVATLTSGRLKLREVTLVKRGPLLDGSARLDDADLQVALPLLHSVTAISGPAGPLTLRGTAGAFGLSASATAIVEARAGRVVVIPQGRLAVLGTITVFDQPDIRVRRLEGAGAPGGLSLTATAELR
ncbi:MAG: hypothetical protein ACRDKL_10020 [Solirubrobacteraceae bacterium]